MSASSDKKSYFKKPENLVNLALIGGAGYVAVQVADKALPTLIRVAENTLYLGLLGGGLLGLGLLVVNKDLHRAGGVLWKMGVRWLTNKITTIEPILLLKEMKDRAQGKVEEMTEAEASLRTQIRSLEQLVASGDQEFQENMKLMSLAKSEAKGGKKKMSRAAVLAGRHAGRVKESNVTLNQLLAKLRQFLDVMVRMREGAEFVVADMDKTIVVKERERNAIRAAYKHLSLAKRVIKGDADKEMYDMTLENLNNDYFEKIGYMEQFMVDSETALDTMDLQKLSYQEDAFADLEAWENKVDAVGGKRVRVDDGAEEQELAEQEEDEDTAPKRQSYANLFDIKK